MLSSCSTIFCRASLSSRRPRGRPGSFSPCSAEVRGVRSSEQPIGLVLPRPVLDEKLAGEVARALEQVAVGSQPRETEIAQPRLPGPEQVPLAPQLEVPLGELEAVGRLDEHLEAR